MSGVNTLEWLFPPAALAHVGYNEAAKAAGQRRAQVVAPGSPLEQQQQAEEEARQRLGEQQAAFRASQPQSPQDELAARRRANSARAELGRVKASTQLTETLG